MLVHLKTQLLFQQQYHLGQKVGSLVKKTAWSNCVLQEEIKCEHNLNLALNAVQLVHRGLLDCSTVTPLHTRPALIDHLYLWERPFVKLQMCFSSLTLKLSSYFHYPVD